MTYTNLGHYFNKEYYIQEYSSGDKIDFKKYIECLKKKEESKDRVKPEGNAEGNAKEANAKSVTEINFDNEKAMDTISECMEFCDKASDNSESFILNTLYPGLIVGMGYAHNSLKTEEYQNGFSFDYTTGLPVIPGSSVKGIIRSAFPNVERLKKIGFNDFEEEFCYESYLEKVKNNEIRVVGTNCEEFYMAIANDLSKLNTLKEILMELKIASSEISYNEFLELTDGLITSLFETANENGERDIYFDAFPEADTNTKILVDDYITCHVESFENEEVDLLKNPTPLKILKLAPDVNINFRFRLSDSKLSVGESQSNKDIVVSKELKLVLFKSLLVLQGVGARTNVGYGLLIDEKVLNRYKSSSDFSIMNHYLDIVTYYNDTKKKLEEDRIIEEQKRVYEEETKNMTDLEIIIYNIENDKMCNDKFGKIKGLFSEVIKTNIDEDMFLISKVLREYYLSNNEWKLTNKKKETKDDIKKKKICEVLKKHNFDEKDLLCTQN